MKFSKKFSILKLINNNCKKMNFFFLHFYYYSLLFLFTDFFHDIYTHNISILYLFLLHLLFNLYILLLLYFPLFLGWFFLLYLEFLFIIDSPLLLVTQEYIREIKRIWQKWLSGYIYYISKE